MDETYSGSEPQRAQVTLLTSAFYNYAIELWVVPARSLRQLRPCFATQSMAEIEHDSRDSLDSFLDLIEDQYIGGFRKQLQESLSPLFQTR